MVRAVVAAVYLMVTFYFLRSYRRLTLFGVIASVLWPLALAFALGAVITLNDDDAMML